MNKRKYDDFQNDVPEFLHDNHRRAQYENNERRKARYIENPDEFYDDHHNNRYDKDYENYDEYDEYDDYDDEYEKPRRRASDQEALRRRVVKRNKKAKRKERRKHFWWAIASICAVGIIVGIGILVGMYHATNQEIKDMDFKAMAQSNPTSIYYIDSDGAEHLYEELSNETTNKWVNHDEISEYMKKATVAIEDKRFYKHKGVDISRTLSATIKYGLSKIGFGESNYGGSTITQQTYKNLTNQNQKTSARKVREILSAVAMERQLSKDEILTIYLNIVYYANGCTGVQNAAKYYFDKDAKDLTLPEAATIAGITQNPTKFDPIKNTENCLSKRNIVLKEMKDQGLITEEEYVNAAETKIILDQTNFNPKKVESYFVEEVIDEVANDLVNDKGYKKDFAVKSIYNGGYKIISTINPDIQKTVDRVYQDSDNFPNAGVQSAMIIMDPYTGQVKAMAGAVGKKESSFPLNRAYSDPHQPGSSIKPLAVYAPAIDSGKIKASTVIEDEEITIGSDNWQPKNSYNGYKGKMLPKEAIARSANIPAVKVLDEIGLSKSVYYLENKFHLSTIVDEDKNYSALALGGLSKGVKVVDMAAAYSVFPNLGKYIKPHTYVTVYAQDGSVFLENNEEGQRVLTPESAYIMSDFLSAPVEMSYGTATSAGLDNMPTYGKTGTTDDNVDKWFVGYTPYYVGVVRYGYDNHSKMNISSNPAINIWKKVMSEVHEDYKYKELEKPDDVEEALLCPTTGKLARTGCSGAYTCYFQEDDEPSYCTYHGGSKRNVNDKSSYNYNDDDDDDYDDEDDDIKPSSKSSSTKTPSKATATPKVTQNPKSTPVPTQPPLVEQESVEEPVDEYTEDGSVEE